MWLLTNLKCYVLKILIKGVCPEIREHKNGCFLWRTWSMKQKQTKAIGMVLVLFFYFLLHVSVNLFYVTTFFCLCSYVNFFNLLIHKGRDKKCKGQKLQMKLKCYVVFYLVECKVSQRNLLWVKMYHRYKNMIIYEVQSIILFSASTIKITWKMSVWLLLSETETILLTVQTLGNHMIVLIKLSAVKFWVVCLIMAFIPITLQNHSKALLTR